MSEKASNLYVPNYRAWESFYEKRAKRDQKVGFGFETESEALKHQQQQEVVVHPERVKACDQGQWGWSGGAMVLGKLLVPGRPTIWISVGQGPTVLAVGAGGGCLDIFTLIYPFSTLSPSLWETARYRLKYCLKGPLNPKQPTNQGQTEPKIINIVSPPDRTDSPASGQCYKKSWREREAQALR